MSFEEQALENPKTEIILGGEEFSFVEPCKRECVRLFAKGLKILMDHGIMEVAGLTAEGVVDVEKVSPESMANVLEAVPELLDFLYELLKLPPEKISMVEEKFVLTEVFEAFTVAIQRLGEPFFIGSQGGKV